MTLLWLLLSGTVADGSDCFAVVRELSNPSIAVITGELSDDDTRLELERWRSTGDIYVFDTGISLEGHVDGPFVLR